MESMETDAQIPQNGDVGENTPPRRRSRFEDAPEDVKGNIPPPGRFTPGAAPVMRPPGLMVPPGARPIPRPLMSANMDEEPPSFFNNTPPRASTIPPRGPRPTRPGLGFAPRPGFPPRPGFIPPMGVPPGQIPAGFRPPVNPQDNIKRWFELAGIEDDVWVETKASGDKCYYYHAVTRATVWQRPEGENARIVDQAGLQAIVEQGMKAEREKNPQGAQPMMTGYPGGYPPVGNVPARMPGDPDSAWAQFMSPEGRPYYYNSITGENTWEKPKALVEKENGTALKPVPVASAPVFSQNVAQPTPVTNNSGSQPNTSADSSRPVNSLPVSGTPCASERRDCFDEYSKERAEIERAERKAKAKEAKENFMKLLEESGLDGKSSYSSFVAKHGKDERFKAVEKNRDREDYFKDYAKAGFIELLKEQEGLHRRSKWSKVKKQIDEDPRYRAKPLDSAWREELFREYISTLSEKETSDDEGKDEHDAPKTAEEIAIENRKREVESELNEQKKERNKEKEIMFEKEEIESYKLILKDLIKHSDYSWHDARKILKKDSRYKRLDYLKREMKEDIYKEHIRELNRKRQDVLFKLFNEESDWNPNTRWKDVKKYVVSDEKYGKFCDNEKKLENDFKDWRRVRLDELLKDFREFLKEVKVITHESKQKILHNEGHLSDILAILQTDKRYLVLDSCPEERELELERYIEDLDRKGPPPPPTASTAMEEH
ncbi:hypothetical protein FO519_007761 [Halicephalobus sp. NKZ332]|nr:hypothetical protein FO519_007761 [Halicephalobus sp. NKZ332]